MTEHLDNTIKNYMRICEQYGENEIHTYLSGGTTNIQTNDQTVISDLKTKCDKETLLEIANYIGGRRRGKAGQAAPRSPSPSRSVPAQTANKQSLFSKGLNFLNTHGADIAKAATQTATTIGQVHASYNQGRQAQTTESPTASDLASESDTCDKTLVALRQLMNELDKNCGSR